jgi:hypothetical protein
MPHPAGPERRADPLHEGYGPNRPSIRSAATRAQAGRQGRGPGVIPAADQRFFQGRGGKALDACGTGRPWSSVRGAEGRTCQPKAALSPKVCSRADRGLYQPTLPTKFQWNFNAAQTDLHGILTEPRLI